MKVSLTSELRQGSPAAAHAVRDVTWHMRQRAAPCRVPRAAVGPGQPESPNSLAISIRWTSLVPSPISRILESRHIRATGYSFMKP